jgi:hypothetical protein
MFEFDFEAQKKNENRKSVDFENVQSESWSFFRTNKVNFFKKTSLINLFYFEFSFVWFKLWLGLAHKPKSDLPKLFPKI